jgi:hypothetical protein
MSCESITNSQLAELLALGAKQARPLASEGHIYDVLNMSLVVPWRRVK